MVRDYLFQWWSKDLLVSVGSIVTWQEGTAVNRVGMILRERRLDIAGVEVVRTRMGRRLTRGTLDMRVSEMSVKKERKIGRLLMKMTR